MSSNTRAPLTYLCVSALLSCITSNAIAQVDTNNNPKAVALTRSAVAVNLPIDSRVVEFPFDSNAIFEVRTKVDNFTRLRLTPSEQVKGFYLSDTVQWEFHVSSDKKNVFIKPKAPSITTSATLVTSKREYDIEFKTSDSNWHQRVSWASSGDEDGRFFEEAQSVATPNQALLQAQAAKAAEPCNPFSTTRRMRYATSAGTPFDPTQVWDDSTFTCIQLPSSVREYPAVFALDANGQGELIDFVIRENRIVVPRVLEYGGLLKLGASAVTVRNLDRKCAALGQSQSCDIAPTNISRSLGRQGVN
jgi:type IV secretion system protein TrbG